MMLRNEKGIVALAVILSMLMTIGAIAVFGFVSGRFGTTYRLYNRPQTMLDAESASYVAYMLMREGAWARDAAAKTVTLNNADSTAVRKSVNITTPVDNNEVIARSRYR